MFFLSRVDVDRYTIARLGRQLNGRIETFRILARDTDGEVLSGRDFPPLIEIGAAHGLRLDWDIHLMTLADDIVCDDWGHVDTLREQGIADVPVRVSTVT